MTAVHLPDGVPQLGRDGARALLRILLAAKARRDGSLGSDTEGPRAVLTDPAAANDGGGRHGG